MRARFEVEVSCDECLETWGDEEPPCHECPRGKAGKLLLRNEIAWEAWSLASQIAREGMAGALQASGIKVILETLGVPLAMQFEEMLRVARIEAIFQEVQKAKKGQEDIQDE